MTISRQDGSEYNLMMHCGDSGHLKFELITPTAEGTLIFMRIYNHKHEAVIPELKSRVNAENCVIFDLTSGETDKLKVRKCEKFKIYYYGLKQVNEETGEENTVFLGENPSYEDLYEIKVFHKKAKGLSE